MEFPVSQPSRRDFMLETAAKAGAFAVTASAPSFLLAETTRPAAYDARDDQYDILMARVKFACDIQVVDVWNVHPGGERNLLEELSSVVHCKVKLAPGVSASNPYYGENKDFNAVITFDDMDVLRNYPIAFMTAEGYFTFSAKQKANLKRYLEEGGFLFMDDCVADMNSDYFFQSSHKLLNEVFGRGAAVAIPRNHEVFHNVYDLGAMGLPHVSGVYHPAEGVFAGQRLAAFLSSTDIHCGWVDRAHRWYPRAGSRPHGYEEAIRMGINVLMYAMSH